VVSEIIPIVHIRYPFGGTRSYFLCPGEAGAAAAAGAGSVGGDGVVAISCGRRVAKLYLSRRYFLCRQCSSIFYTSRHAPVLQRAYDRAAKLRQRLDISGSSVPRKPKGMPVRVYERLLEATLQAETLATEAGTARLLRLADWIDRKYHKSRYDRRRPAA
jgi:hypothetical protein